MTLSALTGIHAAFLLQSKNFVLRIHSDPLKREYKMKEKTVYLFVLLDFQVLSFLYISIYCHRTVVVARVYCVDHMYAIL